MYAYTPEIIPSLITVCFLLVISIYSWRSLRAPGALPFAIGSLFGALWVIAIVLQQAAVEFELKVFWIKVQTAWTLFGITPMVFFSLEYTWPGRWLTRRNLILLSVFPLVTVFFILTNDGHHLVWATFTNLNGRVGQEPGQLNWLFVSYSLLLTGIELLAFAWLFLRSRQHRWPAGLMLFGMFGSRAIFLLGTNDAAGLLLPKDVLAVSFPFLMYAIALFGFRILDPIALARQTALEQIHAGMLVLDEKNRITSLNHAAESILGIDEKQAKGQPINAVLPAINRDLLAGSSGVEMELVFKDRDFSLAVSPLRDWRGLEIGWLALLRDVSEQKQAQKQIIEQQRSLAALKEREHLSRELHDSIGQVLAYAGMQVDAAAKLARDGQGEAAAAQLERLGSVVRDAHADVREYILNLRIAPSRQQPFFQTLRQYLEGFNSNYDIQARLTVSPQLEAEDFSPEDELQILRILQEALSNARKHSQARQVQVSFDVEENQMKMTVQDSGSGFDPQNILPLHGHYGLQFMRERAAHLGGTLEVQTQAGSGTRITLSVPRKER